MGADPAIDDIAVHAGEVGGGGGVTEEEVLRRKGAIADDMHVIPFDRADARKNHGIANLLLLHHSLQSSQQIGLVFETQNHDALELPAQGQYFRDLPLLGLVSSAGVVALVTSFRICSERTAPLAASRPSVRRRPCKLALLLEPRGSWFFDVETREEDCFADFFIVARDYRLWDEGAKAKRGRAEKGRKKHSGKIQKRQRAGALQNLAEFG